MLIPFIDTREIDEVWEFKTLKNEIATTVEEVLL